jgi:hypothetical protein
MICSRRLRTRLSILAIVALLWSQFALAAHNTVCASSAAIPVVASMSCHATPAAQDATTCDSHCQNNQSSDTERVPVPASLLPAPAIPLSTLNNSSVLWLGCDAPAQHALNRPTSHPASSLLI